MAFKIIQLSKAFIHSTFLGFALSRTQLSIKTECREGSWSLYYFITLCPLWWSVCWSLTVAECIMDKITLLTRKSAKRVIVKE